MVKLIFTNAQVKDNGYGLSVNGKELDNIISTALGTRVGNKGGYGSGLPSFESNCCDVTVIINPKPVTEMIETDKYEYDSVEALEEDVNEQYQAETGKAES